jgi:hypothetical protein
VQFTASSAQVDIVALVVVDTSLGKHGIVLNLTLADRGAVVGDDYQLGLFVVVRCGKGEEVRRGDERRCVCVALIARKIWM